MNSPKGQKRHGKSQTTPETSPARPSKQLKDEDIRIRVTAEQKTRLVAQATRAGVGVSTWMLLVALREAERAEGGTAGSPAAPPT